MLTVDDNGPALLNIYGGKITTHRRLAEAALSRLRPFFPTLTGSWTARVPLPGGDFPHDGVEALIGTLCATYPWLSQPEATRLIRAYGTEAVAVLGTATSPADLGRDFGGDLYEAEVRWQMTHEWALRAEDVVWRRTKLGLRMTPDQIATLDDFMTSVKN